MFNGRGSNRRPSLPIPGSLIRVPAETEIQLTIRNMIDTSLTMLIVGGFRGSALGEGACRPRDTDLPLRGIDAGRHPIRFRCGQPIDRCEQAKTPGSSLQPLHGAVPRLKIEDLIR